MPTFNCPHCGDCRSVPDKYAGRKVKCPKCGNTGRVEPTPPPPSEPPEAFVVMEEERTPYVQATPTPRRPAEPNFFLGLLDLKLERYVTPTICRVTWVLALIQASMWLLLEFLGPWIREQATEAGKLPEVFAEIPGLFWFLTRIIAAVLILLWIRVILESAVVYFNIHYTLKDIRTNTGRTESGERSWS